jgi:hypothetical protein
MQVLYDNWAMIIFALFVILFYGGLLAKAEGWGKDTKHKQ